LNQKVGNFPGVTVDLKVGVTKLNPQLTAEIIDLPGTYSLYPKRADEWVTYDTLLNPHHPERPDMVVIVADASNLKRNLLFCSQIIDLKLPTVVVLTMLDISKQKGVEIDMNALQRELGVPVLAVNPRKNKGTAELKKTLEQLVHNPAPSAVDFVPGAFWGQGAVEAVQQAIPGISDYHALHYAMNHEGLQLPDAQKQAIANALADKPFNKTRAQADEIMHRYQRINQIMNHAVSQPDPKRREIFTEQLDKLLLHRFWGYIILLAVLFILFQSVFWLAQMPVDWLETAFAQLGGWLGGVLPKNWVGDLVINGLVAGLSGILVFVPQIAILFGLISLLEDTGYMARISFLSDRLMRSVGLNGKSVVPMISGFACAVPAIMSARNIENRKERLLTILVTPLMSCSARLPVYTTLTGLVIPKQYIAGIFSLKGLVMLGLYLLGIILALVVSWVFNRLLKIKERSFFLLELPMYRSPRWPNIGLTMMQKAKVFVKEAGKVIMIISLCLWALSSFGPSGKRRQVDEKYEALILAQPQYKDSLERMQKAERLEYSYAGYLGKTIEPAIKPLGYDWKIGIALITSFAAREVFVGTMATLYSVGEDEADSDLKLRDKMKQARLSDGRPVYTLATGVSLMVFYALAMQCMSTLAIVRRETRSWKWPVIQLAYMTALAYLCSWLAYWLLK
jgi:ferrous iron transport protein B